MWVESSVISLVFNKLEFYEQIIVLLPDIKFHEYPLNNSRDVSAFRQGDKVTDGGWTEGF
jgi:hypothetical protein